MAREAMVMSLTKSGGSNPEGVIINASGNRWTSPPGGWLKVQEGVWHQNSRDLVLLDPAADEQVAVCSGCHFESVGKGGSGKAAYPPSGDVGSWSVVDITS